jgi:plasmid stabilization system protein ParE
MKVVWTEQAWGRLLEIEQFIGRDDPKAAARLVDKLIDRGDGLADHPMQGRRLPELPESGLRELIVGNYRIVDRRTSNAVEVLTVFEGRRLLRLKELANDE